MYNGITREQPVGTAYGGYQATYAAAPRTYAAATSTYAAAPTTTTTAYAGAGSISSTPSTYTSGYAMAAPANTYAAAPTTYTSFPQSQSLTLNPPNLGQAAMKGHTPPTTASTNSSWSPNAAPTWGLLGRTQSQTPYFSFTNQSDKPEAPPAYAAAPLADSGRDPYYDRDVRAPMPDPAPPPGYHDGPYHASGSIEEQLHQLLEGQQDIRRQLDELNSRVDTHYGEHRDAVGSLRRDMGDPGQAPPAVPPPAPQERQYTPQESRPSGRAPSVTTRGAAATSKGGGGHKLCGCISI